MSSKPILQRNFDWLSRYLFARSGVAQEPSAVIEVGGHAWPKPWRTEILAAITTAVGFVQTVVTVPEDEHWLIDAWVAIGAMPATDILQVNIAAPITAPGGFTFYLQTGTALNVVPILGKTGISGNLVPVLPGPLYLPPGTALAIGQSSVAGGVVFSHRVRRRIEKAYVPLLP